MTTLLQGAGVQGVLVDTDRLDRSAWDATGSALEAGLEIGLGALPTNALQTTPDQIARRAMAALRDLAVDATRSGQLMLTPAWDWPVPPPTRRSAPCARCGPPRTS